MNSKSSQDTRSHGTNSMSSYSSSSPVYFPSPAGEEFTVLVLEAPCPMQAKPGHHLHLICITCNAMTRLWSAECAVRELVLILLLPVHTEVCSNSLKGDRAYVRQEALCVLCSVRHRLWHYERLKGM